MVTGPLNQLHVGRTAFGEAFLVTNGTLMENYLVPFKAIKPINCDLDQVCQTTGNEVTWLSKLFRQILKVNDASQEASLWHLPAQFNPEA